MYYQITENTFLYADSKKDAFSAYKSLCRYDACPSDITSITACQVIKAVKALYTGYGVLAISRRALNLPCRDILDYFENHGIVHFQN